MANSLAADFPLVNAIRSPDDVKQLAVPVLAHRVILRTHWDATAARTEDPDVVIREILQKIPVPR